MKTALNAVTLMVQLASTLQTKFVLSTSAYMIPRRKYKEASFFDLFSYWKSLPHTFERIYRGASQNRFFSIAELKNIPETILVLVLSTLFLSLFVIKYRRRQ
jgi:hypothetical protein